jgi:hypothetical protein
MENRRVRVGAATESTAQAWRRLAGSIDLLSLALLILALRRVGKIQQLLRAATVLPKLRRPTKVPRGAIRRRHADKAHRSEVKQGRGGGGSGGEG